MGEESARGRFDLSPDLQEHIAVCDSCRQLQQDLERKAFGARVGMRYEELRALLGHKAPPRILVRNGLEYYFLPADSQFGFGMTIVVDASNELVAAEEEDQPEIRKPIGEFSYVVLSGKHGRRGDGG